MFSVKDRVKQGTATEGLNNITFSSSFDGYQDFSSLGGNGTQTFYAIEESTNWEVGIGTFITVPFEGFTRDTIIDSASGAGNKIYLSGAATIFVTYPASGSVFTTGNIASITGVKLGASGISFNDGSTQTTAATSFSLASGARIDLNDGRISIIEATGVATAANLLATGATNAAAIAAVTPFSLASGARVDLNTTNLASTGSTLYVNSVTTGNVLNTRISTIESTGVATAANLASTGGTLYSNSVTTGNVLQARISTIESTGVATAANLIATGAVVQDGHQDINVSIATASGIVTPLISGNSTANTYLDLSLGSNFNYVLTTNTRFLTQNVTKGQKFTLRTEQDSGGTNTVTWAMGEQIKWAEGGTAPTGTYYGGKADFYGFVAVETGLFDGFVIGSNIQ